ncbi:MAG: F0F1 ATP synthase subunit alpha [Thermoflexales bacterium]|nr:F0F1 ATP synthase subunit alpha [Thermoflexales bacterium]
MTTTLDVIGELTASLQQQIALFEPDVTSIEVGRVAEVGDGIARVTGLPAVRANEMVRFESGTLGIAFNLEHDHVGVIIMGEYSDIEEGQMVQAVGRIVSVPVGDSLVGRVVDVLGQPIDGKGPVVTGRFRTIERIAPGVIERANVDTALQTGIKAIDAMIPIGRGQRELIIGDRQTGKTALAIDTIINQKDKGLYCIYVAIGQKLAQVARVVATLERRGALEYTTVVVASASDPATLQYLAPYAGCAMGEEAMENGVLVGGEKVNDALVIYDDLSKHAWAYRQVSLLLRRPPGREAYPGDVFYLHSRLLERAARLAPHYILRPRGGSNEQAQGGERYTGVRGRREAESALKSRPDAEQFEIVPLPGTGGSLTALPIIETLLGDVSAYIPTNVISITDGQIYLESDLFNAGIRPAINVGISVSRVGGDAQTKAMKQVAGRLRLDMSQFRELAVFAQFGSDLDKATLARLERGRRLQEILKQPQYVPMSLAHQVTVIFAGTQGYADTIPLARMREWESGLLRFLDTHYPNLGESIARDKKLDEKTEQALRTAIEEFNKTFV